MKIKDYRTYPAAYEKVVSVAAYAPDYKKSWYSNFADWVDIAARAGHTAMGGSITVNALYTVRYRITSTAICRGHLWLVLMFRVSLL